MTRQLSIDGTFDACHRLYEYEGDCSNLHGHTYRIRVTVASKELDDLGMILDFKILKKILNSIVPDHAVVLSNNDPLASLLIEHGQRVIFLMGNPTAENMVKFYHEEFQHQLDNHTGSDTIRVIRTEVWETATSRATYESI